MPDGEIFEKQNNSVRRWDRLPEFLIDDGVLVAYLGNGKTATVPDGVTRIGEGAFCGTDKLEEVTLPKGVKRIDKRAFSGCTALRRVSSCEKASDAAAVIDIPESVTRIGEYAFCGCEGVEKARIPRAVERIDVGVFSDCKSLTEIAVDKDNKAFSDSGNCLIDRAARTVVAGCKNSTLRGDGSVTKIGESAFSGMAIEKLHIPNCVTELGEFVFYMSGLTELTIPGSIANVPKSAASRCASLKRVTLGKGVETVAGFSFVDDESLESVDLPKTLTALGDGAFNGCKSLKSVVVPKTVAKLGCKAFCDCEALERVELPPSLDVIDWGCFASCTALKTIVMPKKSKKIEWNAFRNCKSLAELTIPSGVEIIASGAFVGCESLKRIVIPKSVKIIDSSFEPTNVFQSCTSLESIAVERGNETYYAEGNCLIIKASGELLAGCKTSVIPKFGVKAICRGAFGGCGIEALEIPASVDRVRDGAFSGCNKLRISVDADSARYCVVDNCLIDKEKHALKFANAESEIPSDGSVTKIAWGAFCDMDFESLTLPNCITEIGMSAFSGCKKLETVKLPKNLKVLEMHAFYDCAALENIVLPASLGTIGYSAFEKCAALEKIIIPSGVTSIGDRAFGGCKSLRRVVLPDTLADLQSGVFSGCEALETVELDGCERYRVDGGCIIDTNKKSLACCFRGNTIPADGSVERIGMQAFDRRDDVRELEIPDTVKYIDERAISCKNIQRLILPDSVQTIATRGVWYCSGLKFVLIPASVETVGERAFQGCERKFKILCEADNEPVGFADKWNEIDDFRKLSPDPIRSVGKYLAN